MMHNLSAAIETHGIMFDSELLDWYISPKINNAAITGQFALDFSLSFYRAVLNSLLSVIIWFTIGSGSYYCGCIWLLQIVCLPFLKGRMLIFIFWN
jgi:hypothetical protein